MQCLGDMPGSKAQKISMAREQFSSDAKRESVIMVGDSLSDIRAAKEASVKSVAVGWGHQSLKSLASRQPRSCGSFSTRAAGGD